MLVVVLIARCVDFTATMVFHVGAVQNGAALERIFVVDIPVQHDAHIFARLVKVLQHHGYVVAIQEFTVIMAAKAVSE